MARLLGIDLGSRRIGIALSDAAGAVATPYLVLPRTNDEHDAQAIAELAGAEGVRTVVLGHPITLGGRVESAALLAESFAKKLREAGMRVRLWDERLSTAEADKHLKKLGVKGPKRREVVDKMAAAIILQSFLDAKT